MTFNLQYSNDFTNGPLGPEWTRYNGIPACCPTSRWDRDNVEVKDGELKLHGYRVPGTNDYHTAGVSLPHLNFTYGRWRLRMKLDKGQGIKLAGLLWPAEGFQPPEIDFIECSPGDANREHIMATLHYPPVRGKVVRKNVDVDFSEWHTWGVTWRPGVIGYTLDGKTWATVRDDVEGVEKGQNIIPKTPMHFGIQTTMGDLHHPKPDASTPDEVSMHIDWIKVWSYTR